MKNDLKELLEYVGKLFCLILDGIRCKIESRHCVNSQFHQNSSRFVPIQTGKR